MHILTPFSYLFLIFFLSNSVLFWEYLRLSEFQQTNLDKMQSCIL